MRPPFIYNREHKEQKKIERSNFRYIGIVCTLVGFGLLLISILTGGKFNKDYGLLVILSPFLMAILAGLLCGSLHFIVNATKTFVELIVDVYTGYDFDELKKYLS